MTNFKALGYEHFMKCFKPAWDMAFNKDLNMAGWRVEGMIPFTRHALWRKVEECQLLDSSFSLTASPGSLPPSHSSSPQDKTPSPNNIQSTPPLAPSAPPPLRSPPLPAAVSEALDYMQSIAPAASGILDMQAVVMENLRLVEAARVIWEWRKVSTVEEDNSNKNNRIYSRNIYGHVGSATGDEALAMLKKNQDERVEAAAAADAKREQSKIKKTADTTILVTAGSEILTRLERLGPSELPRLKVDELHALLVNADPLGSIPKPNKKTGLEKANLFPTVQAAFGRFLAVAATSAPQAPPLTPIPFAPVTCEGENIPNLQVEGLPEIFLPVFDPVLTFATDAILDVEVAVPYAKSCAEVFYVSPQSIE